MPSLALDFSSSVGLLFDTAQIEIASLAKLKKTISTDVVFMAALRSSIAGDYSREGGSLSVVQTGSPAISGSKTVLNSGNSYIDFDNIKNGPMISTAGVKFKYTPKYSGTPSTAQYIGVITENRANDLNRIIIAHNTGDGRFYFQGLSADGASYNNTSAPWSPTTDQEYEFELNVDWTNGVHKFLVDGVVMVSVSTTPGKKRNYACGLIRFGDTYNGATGNNAQFAIRDVIFYDSVQHTANYTPGYSLPAIYPVATTRSIQSNSGIRASAWSAFATVESASGSDTVKHSPIINGVRKYWNGSAWVTASGSQANTAAEINSNCSSLISGIDATIDLISYLTSADGSTTPTLTSATITYTAGVRTGMPATTDVRSGSVFNYGASTGSLVTPALSAVKIGVAGDGGVGTYDGSDRNTDPLVANVKAGVTYKSNSTSVNRTGTLVVSEVTEFDLTQADAAFLQDMGQAVEWTIGPTSYSFFGLLDEPDQMDGGQIISTEYKLTMLTNEAATLTRGQAITVAGSPYIVREKPRKVDDGIFCKIELSAPS